MASYVLSKQDYLYGVGAEVEEIPAELIARRVEILKENLEILYDAHYMVRDEERIRAVHKAITFWQEI